MIGAPEIIFIVLIVLLLFGGKKIPELMNGLGKGVKSFKQGMSGIEEEIKRPVDTPETAAPKQDQAAAANTPSNTSDSPANAPADAPVAPNVAKDEPRKD